MYGTEAIICHRLSRVCAERETCEKYNRLRWLSKTRVHARDWCIRPVLKWKDTVVREPRSVHEAIKQYSNRKVTEILQAMITK